MAMAPSQPLKLVYCYAPRDGALRDQLDRHLAALRRANLIETWYDGKIVPGTTRQTEINNRLHTADIILLLVSADFINSDYCYSVEMSQSLKRHHDKEALVIPILLRPAQWAMTPLRELQMIPTNVVPVTGWRNRDASWVDVTQYIQRAVEYLLFGGSCDRLYTPSQATPDQNGMWDRAEREHLMRTRAIESRNLQDRLDHFVGRAQEQADLRRKIDELLPVGGYLTIIGQPGQGKSSIIAKLIDTYAQKQGGLERVAYHFIPLTPGADHQVVLLRNLMTRLMLKYDLSVPDKDIATENRAVLGGAFSHMLKEVAAKGGREVIFIDGLDQLLTEPTGQRDLSFLPQGPGNPPAGIVFVIGTRPNATLRSLEQRKLRDSYQLRDLSREDFDLILQHYGVAIERLLADQLYNKLKGNALFLDLVAKLLTAPGNLLSVEEIIREIADDPDGLFSLVLERLQRSEAKDAWANVLKPLLGLLLVACEPLEYLHLKQLLNAPKKGLVDSEQLGAGLERLSDFIAMDEQHRYALFHLKLYDFLRQDPKHSTSKGLFDAEEEQGWHQRFIAWCEQKDKDLADIWQENRDAPERARRRYARQHYITHLYQARAWDKLFAVLDEGSYGRAKLQYDPAGMRSYALDLDRGRMAASSPDLELQAAIHLLPRLWNYTLLQCSLTSRADNYPIEAFELMLLLGEEEKARGLAELVTVPEHKIEVLVTIARHIARDPERTGEVRRIQQEISKVERASRSITKEVQQVRASHKLGKTVTRAQRWRERQTAISLGTQTDSRSETLSNEAARLAREQSWQEAEKVCDSIPNKRSQAKAFGELGKALEQAQQDARRIWQKAEQVSDSIPHERSRAKALSELGTAFAQAQCEQDARSIWRKAEQICGSITNERSRAEALIDLGKALAQVQPEHEARSVWLKAEEVSASITDEDWRAEACCELAKAFAQAHHWQDARRVIDSITDGWWRSVALGELGKTLALAQRWSEAKQVSYSITGKEWQVVTLGELGKALEQAQCEQDARHIWQEAEEVSDSIPDKGWQAEALIELGRTMAQAQRGQEAERIWRKAELACHSITSTGWQAEAFCELVKALARAQLWSEAERVSKSIIKGWWREAALCELAKTLAWAQRWSKAKQVSGSITDNGWRVIALSERGKALTLAHHWPEAERIWREAEKASDSIPDREWQAVVLSERGKALAQAQRWSEAEQVISSIQDEGRRVEALGELAGILASHHQNERAVRLVHSWWIQAKTRDEALKLLPLAYGLIQHYPELGRALYHAFAWVDNFLRKA